MSRMIREENGGIKISLKIVIFSVSVNREVSKKTRVVKDKRLLRDKSRSS